ncbi:hypothetical protein K491DRAFT_692987 [Lophiostoma macrostomum CBS 122681]|uniref:Uncharacterized protein n=1 Tax=Lophiostoma macrostomum CBS 122681 TaxID=1314788 RepID=A0A6A6T5U4_9PLEO|nr:hypothetical protein K491DRAFT_692987 [Lophiostoma macrostomum CBS 122681]
MDEDLLELLAVMAGFIVIFIGLPLAIVLTITGCIAYSRTKKWDRERNQRTIKLESEPLVGRASTSSEDEDEFYDTEDEEEHTKRKAEEDADNLLTFRQKFRKEFGKCWKGKNMEEMRKEKEREERRQLAKAVAKELDRRDRRRERAALKKMGEDAAELESLPPYKS